MGEADAVAGGGAEVGVVEEPVNGGTGEGLGHDLVEPAGVEVGADGDAAFLVGGADQVKEAAAEASPAVTDAAKDAAGTSKRAVREAADTVRSEATDSGENRQPI